jgi:outer membrane protein assembly factor BamB
LNTLLGINAYNGTILWRRPLKEGFMIHRNTMIATPEYLYLGDDESCKRLDAATGTVTDEIRLPAGLADGPVWKWMAFQNGVLYALVGGKEVAIRTQPSAKAGLGHWPWGMWEGHEYADPRTSFGFGRTLVAVDPDTKRVLWSHRDEDFLDSRGVCMNGARLFFYCPEKFLGCLDIKTGEVLWKCEAPDLLAAIGPNGRAQHYVTGYSTTTYIKCNDRCVFLAGPQRSRLVVASAEDGRLLWQKEHGNLQLVLRDDGFYAAGPGDTGCKLAYEDGSVLARLPVRRACTRATGSLDSIFYRTSGGTVRIETDTNAAKHIAPMRPPCQDGVIISNGMLYWGPWMCGCQLSFYGHIGLASAGSFEFAPKPDASRLQTQVDPAATVQPLPVRQGDWPTYGGDSVRTMRAGVVLPREAAHKWTADVSPGVIPSAPVTADRLVFTGSRNGTVQALHADTGKLCWRAFTGGAVNFPPAIWQGRAFAGSADGYVYAFEAATGRQLWRFRAAPADRLISVYDAVSSTWPVAGGVVVDEGTVYVAAGIAHYDGTHVFALDALTGKVKWYNGTSGAMSKVDSGVSLQGSLSIRDGELRFIGGGVHEVARYDLKTGKCLNPPHDPPNSTFQTAFYAYYPAYGGYLSLDQEVAKGSLVYDASYEGALHGSLKLLPAGAAKPPKPESRWGYLRGRRPREQAIWQDRSGQRFRAFAVDGDTLLAAGDRVADGKPAAFLAAINIEDGKDVWRHQLPALAVQGGLAVNHQGQVFVTLENGSLMCFATD